MSSDTSSSPPVADVPHPTPGGGADTWGKDLRFVERDIVVTKMVKNAAKVTCAEHVTAFENCCRGRSVSIVWACRKENDALLKCMHAHMQEPDFQREANTFRTLKAEAEAEAAASGGGAGTTKSNPKPTQRLGGALN